MFRDLLRRGRWIVIHAWFLVACSSTQVNPPSPEEGKPEASNSQLNHFGGVLDLPHPVGMDYADLREIFFSPSAPKVADLKSCDKEVNQLIELTLAKAEFEKGVRELVKASPQLYHWCFYGKLMGLVQDLRGDQYIDQKQKLTVSTFQVLVPVARAMLEELQDSRYLRWAVRSYQRMSEWVFYRRLELSPLGTSEMIGLGSDYVTERRDKVSGEDSVLTRYGIRRAPASEPNPPQPEVAPAIEPEVPQVTSEKSESGAEVKPEVDSGGDKPPEI